MHSEAMIFNFKMLDKKFCEYFIYVFFQLHFQQTISLTQSHLYYFKGQNVKLWLISNISLHHVWTHRTTGPSKKKTLFNNKDTLHNLSFCSSHHFYDDFSFILLSTHIRISYCIIPFTAEVAEFFHSWIWKS